MNAEQTCAEIIRVRQLIKNLEERYNPANQTKLR